VISEIQSEYVEYLGTNKYIKSVDLRDCLPLTGLIDTGQGFRPSQYNKVYHLTTEKDKAGIVGIGELAKLS
jgi:hypothetical protein